MHYVIQFTIVNYSISAVKYIYILQKRPLIYKLILQTQGGKKYHNSKLPILYPKSSITLLQVTTHWTITLTFNLDQSQLRPLAISHHIYLCFASDWRLWLHTLHVLPCFNAINNTTTQWERLVYIIDFSKWKYNNTLDRHSLQQDNT